MSEDVSAIVKRFLDESVAAESERRTPHTISVSRAEYNELSAYFGFMLIKSAPDASLRSGSIRGVPLQVIA